MYCNLALCLSRLYLRNMLFFGTVTSGMRMLILYQIINKLLEYLWVYKWQYECLNSLKTSFFNLILYEPQFISFLLSSVGHNFCFKWLKSIKITTFSYQIRMINLAYSWVELINNSNIKYLRWNGYVKKH